MKLISRKDRIQCILSFSDLRDGDIVEVVDSTQCKDWIGDILKIIDRSGEKIIGTILSHQSQLGCQHYDTSSLTTCRFSKLPAGTRLTFEI